MNIIWQGTDITGYVTVRKAVARDTCGGRCDGLEIEFENAERWYSWGPDEDDRIRVEQDGWDSGELYLNTVCPEERKFRVIATALPCKARRKAWNSFEGLKIREIMDRCAAQSGMDWRSFGIDVENVIPYIQQENEGTAAFLHRLATLEGAKLKCVNGRYTLIGIDWAQERKAGSGMLIQPDQEGISYRRSGAKISALTVETPYARGRAKDGDVKESKPTAAMNDIPAMNDIQAARWARNLLKAKNRCCESVTAESVFRPAWSAMERVDIAGRTDASGEWLIEDAEHDLIEGTSRATMFRCIRNIS